MLSSIPGGDSIINIKGDSKKLLYKDYQVSYEYSVKLKNRKDIKKGEKISIISDTMFKTMFFNEKRIKYSAKLLSFIIDIPYERLLTKIRLSKNELDKEKEYIKSERCDYVAEIDGTYLNIEMNCNDNEYLMDRNLEYAYKLFSSNNIIQKGYNYKQLIQINLNNFSFKGLDKVMYISGVENEKFRQTNNIIIIQIFLPNIYKKCYNLGKVSLTKLERFLLSMIEYNIDEAKEFALEDKVMNEYIEESEYVTFNNGFGEAYDKEWALKDLGKQEGYIEGKVVGFNKGKKEGIEEGKKEGKEEGKKEGIEEGKKEKAKDIAKELLKQNIDIKIISEVTNISIDELNKLNNN